MVVLLHMKERETTNGCSCPPNECRVVALFFQVESNRRLEPQVWPPVRVESMLLESGKKEESGDPRRNQRSLIDDEEK